jgi:PAS domain S-box-containing protein
VVNAGSWHCIEKWLLFGAVVRGIVAEFLSSVCLAANGEAAYGGCRDQVVGHNCRFMQGPHTDPAEIARLKQAMADEQPVTVRLLNYRQDGTKFWNNLHVAPIRNADGEVRAPTSFHGFCTSAHQLFSIDNVGYVSLYCHEYCIVHEAGQSPK